MSDREKEASANMSSEESDVNEPVVPIQEPLGGYEFRKLHPPVRKRYKFQDKVAQQTAEKTAEKKAEKTDMVASVASTSRTIEEDSDDVGTPHAGDKPHGKAHARIPPIYGRVPSRKRDQEACKAEGDLSPAKKIPQSLPASGSPKDRDRKRKSVLPPLAPQRREQRNAVEGPPESLQAEAGVDLSNNRERRISKQRDREEPRPSTSTQHPQIMSGEERESGCSGNEFSDNEARYKKRELRQVKRKLVLRRNSPEARSVRAAKLGGDKNNAGGKTRLDSFAGSYGGADQPGTSRVEPEISGAKQGGLEGETKSMRKKGGRMAGVCETGRRNLPSDESRERRKRIPVPLPPTGDLPMMLARMPLRVVAIDEWGVQQDEIPDALPPFNVPKQSFAQRGDAFVQLRDPLAELGIGGSPEPSPSQYTGYAPLQLAVAVQEYCNAFYTLCHGCFGGIALAHLILTCTLHTSSTDDVEDFIGVYSSFARYIQALFAFLSAVCLVSVFDRFDVRMWSRIDKCCSAGSMMAVLIVACYSVTFVINAAAVPWDDRLSMQSGNDSMWTSRQTVATEMMQWKVLTLIRCSGALLGWIFIALSSHEHLLLKELVMLQDQDDLSYQAEGLFRPLGH